MTSSWFEDGVFVIFTFFRFRSSQVFGSVWGEWLYLILKKWAVVKKVLAKIIKRISSRGSICPRTKAATMDAIPHRPSQTILVLWCFLKPFQKAIKATGTMTRTIPTWNQPCKKTEPINGVRVINKGVRKQWATHSKEVEIPIRSQKSLIDKGLPTFEEWRQQKRTNFYC